MQQSSNQSSASQERRHIHTSNPHQKNESTKFEKRVVLCGGCNQQIETMNFKLKIPGRSLSLFVSMWLLALRLRGLVVFVVAAVALDARSALHRVCHIGAHSSV